MYVTCVVFDVLQKSPPHQFVIGQMLEAANPINPNQMCVARVVRILGR